MITDKQKAFWNDPKGFFNNQKYILLKVVILSYQKQ